MDDTRQNRPAPRAVLLCSAAFFCVCAGFTAMLPCGVWPDLLICAVCAFSLGGLAVLAFHGRYAALAAGLVMGLLCCGVHGLLRWQPSQKLAGLSGECRVALTDYAQGRGGWGVAWGRLISVGGTKGGYSVKVYLEDGSPEYRPGDLLIFEGTVRSGSAELRDGLLQKGVFLTVRQTGTLKCEENGAAGFLTGMRRFAGAIRNKIALLLSSDEAGLLSAFLTGGETGCSDAFIAALNAAGLRHITSVSGLHLAILAGFLIQLLGRRAGVYLSLPVVFLYAAIAGFPAATVRAAVMQAFVLAAFIFRRENDSPTALSASLLFLCVLNPFSSLAAGLLLSFSATAGILWLYPCIIEPLRKRQPKSPVIRMLWRYIAETLAVSLAATVCTLPVTLLWFGGASLIAVPMNLLCLWAVNLSMLLGIFALCLAALVPAAAPAAGWVLWWPLRYLTALIGAAGRLPFASSRAGLYLALGAVSLLLLFFGLRRGTKRVLPLTAVILCLCFVLSALESRLTTAVEISGKNGAVMLALHSGGETAFVGCGASDDIAAQFIRDAMARRGAGKSVFLLATGGGWKETGGAHGAAEAARAPALTVPAGTSLETTDNLPVLWYTDGGKLDLGKLTISLLPVGEQYACRISGAGISLLSLCDTEPWEALSDLAQKPCTAGLLVIDNAWTASPGVLSRMCALTGARGLIYSDDGWSTASGNLCGLPVTVLSEAKTVILETMR